jgi:hypothetical protein
MSLMRTVCAALALSVGALCTQPAIAADRTLPRTAPVVGVSDVAPAVVDGCYRFILQQWSWYDYCWAERHPVAWRAYARPLRVRG